MLDGLSQGNGIKKEEGMAKMGIGYGHLTEKIYLGRQNKEKGRWVGDKEDITSDFLFVLVQYIPKQTTRTIVCGESESTVLHISNTKEGYEKAIKYLQKCLTTAST
jgi:hypothetical protein